VEFPPPTIKGLDNAYTNHLISDPPSDVARKPTLAKDDNPCNVVCFMLVLPSDGQTFGITVEEWSASPLICGEAR